MRIVGMRIITRIKKMMSMVMRTGISYLNIWIRMMMMVRMVLSEDEEVVDEDDDVPFSLSVDCSFISNNRLVCPR